MHHYNLMYLEEYARGALVEILAADRRHTEGLRKVEASFSSLFHGISLPQAAAAAQSAAAEAV